MSTTEKTELTVITPHQVAQSIETIISKAIEEQGLTSENIEESLKKYKAIEIPQGEIPKEKYALLEESMKNLKKTRTTATRALDEIKDPFYRVYKKVHDLIEPRIKPIKEQESRFNAAVIRIEQQRQKEAEKEMLEKAQGLITFGFSRQGSIFSYGTVRIDFSTKVSEAQILNAINQATLERNNNIALERHTKLSKFGIARTMDQLIAMSDEEFKAELALAEAQEKGKTFSNTSSFTPPGWKTPPTPTNASAPSATPPTLFDSTEPTGEDQWKTEVQTHIKYVLSLSRMPQKPVGPKASETLKEMYSAIREAIQPFVEKVS